MVSPISSNDFWASMAAVRPRSRETMRDEGLGVGDFAREVIILDVSVTNSVSQGPAGVGRAFGGSFSMSGRYIFYVPIIPKRQK